tara:strand:+ start:327 stop:674 length:348 start_codon:yes stop_codon:yes gene_type:complete
MSNNKKGAIENLTDKLKSFPDRFTLADEQTDKDRKGYIENLTDKLKSFPDRFTLADEQNEKEREGLFESIKKKKAKKKSAAEEMADLEFKLGKKQKGFSRGGRAAIKGFKFGGIK